ncbi:hypothetical protein BSK62_26275 [Paenibacillus odorifer]|uniref:hypothetical protein n=1 Tax=Paenibacillus TaxID=44249 RepID=UPI00097B6123|nr:hypothetical protein [Paenibacillus odorifer]OMD59856.1 hypothetical protein BSK62_26275 [Paenibacillus odorifer]
MAITKDESAWPIISLSLGEAFDQETVEEYIAYWEELLARQSAFGLLMVHSAEKNTRPERAVTQLYMNWCKMNKREIAQYCSGIAVVMQNAKLLAVYKPVTALSTKRTYGCPGGAFSGEAEAIRWLEEQLTKTPSGTKT